MRASAGRIGIIALTSTLACGSTPMGVNASGSTDTADTMKGRTARPSGSVTALGKAAEAPTRVKKLRLGEPAVTALELSVEPVFGEKSVLFVAQSAGERAAWVRRYQSATRRLGPLIRLVDAYVITAFESSDGERMTLVSSDGEDLCLSTFRGDADEPEARGCADVSPFAAVPLGERFALIEAEIERPPATPPAKSAAAATTAAAGAAKQGQAAPKQGRGATKQGATKQGATKQGATTNKKSAGSTTPARGSRSKPSRTTKKTQGRADGAKGAQIKGSKGGAAQKPQGAGKPKAQAKASAPKRPPRTDKVNVRLRWMTAKGEVSDESVVTGLRFERPLEGMSLVDARARGGAVDLLWFEASPKRITAAPMGSARLAAGSLGPDGMFIASSRVPVLEGDLEYGGITGHHGMQLVTTEGASTFVGLTGRPGGCEAVRVAPSLSLLQAIPAVCSVAPGRLAFPGSITSEEVAALTRILASDPRRAFGQPHNDPGLAAWAGDEAFFLGEGKLRRAARADGIARDAEAPFPARRSRIEWGAVAPDGEGIAVAAGRVYRVDARGALASTEVTTEGSKVAASPLSATGAPRSPEVPRAQDLSKIERRRAARIGSSWWLARGDVTRLAPDHAVAAALRGRAHPDATALVGGRDRALFIEVVSGRLYRAALDASGATSALDGGSPGGGGSGADADYRRSSIESPVRVGFDAAERRGGGAIVAGISAASPAKVIAFAIDAEGRVGPAHETPLLVGAGELAVRLTALPAGGALLTNFARSQVVWLDEAGRSVGAAAWPAEDSGAVCVDGTAGRPLVPSLEPGKLVRVPELGSAGICVVGEVTWAEDGSLRWFGSAAQGLDAIAEVSILPGLAAPVTSARASMPVPAPVPAPAPAPAPPEPEPPCSADMVSITGGFCIDRFESMLVDATTGEVLSPDYPSTPNLLESILAEWTTGRTRTGDALARGLPLPFLPRWQRGAKTQPVAVSRAFVRPNGYVTGLVAESACAAAGKRLCSLDEFTTACRGEDDTLFPYGDTYVDGVCNVFRDSHPAAILHGNASVGHLDPRLNRVRADGQPLLRATGATGACRSRWGSDAVYDLVGNLDEWVDEEGGAFAGGFYARSTRSGCEALITSHPKPYLDYSTGIRCCRDAAGASPSKAPSDAAEAGPPPR